MDAARSTRAAIMPDGPVRPGERSVVPRHREIDYGLARKICRQLQVPPPPGPR
jgi:hypothetical protein